MKYFKLFLILITIDEFIIPIYCRHHQNLIEQLIKYQEQIKNNFNQIQRNLHKYPTFRRNRNHFETGLTFMFNCDGLKKGFYADIYNDCKYFHLCHPPLYRFKKLFKDKFAITTYACPENTYFNQKQLTCTDIDDLETTCEEQIYLFKYDDKNEFLNKEMENKNLDNLDLNQYEQNINDKLDEDKLEIIETTFSCDNRPYGYYADINHDCKIFHVCQFIQNSTKTYLQSSFRCPLNTLFNQNTLTCTNETNLKMSCIKQDEFYDTKFINRSEANKFKGEDQIDFTKNQQTLTSNEEITTITSIL